MCFTLPEFIALTLPSDPDSSQNMRNSAHTYIYSTISSPVPQAASDSRSFNHVESQRTREESPPPYQSLQPDFSLALGSIVAQIRPSTENATTSEIRQDKHTRAKRAEYECPLCLDSCESLSNIPCGHVFCTPYVPPYT